MKRNIWLKSIKQCYIASPFLFISIFILSVFMGLGEPIKIYILQHLINSIQNFNSKNDIIVYITLFFCVNLFIIIISQINGYLNQIFVLKIEYFLFIFIKNFFA